MSIPLNLKCEKFFLFIELNNYYNYEHKVTKSKEELLCRNDNGTLQEGSIS